MIIGLVMGIMINWNYWWLLIINRSSMIIIIITSIYIYIDYWWLLMIIGLVITITWLLMFHDLPFPSLIFHHPGPAWIGFFSIQRLALRGSMAGCRRTVGTRRSTPVFQWSHLVADTSDNFRIRLVVNCCLMWTTLCKTMFKNPSKA